MKVISFFIFWNLILLTNISFSQKSNIFSGQWCSAMENGNNDCWQINMDNDQINGTSTLIVWENQLIYECTNKMVADTLFFYFQQYDAGMGGRSEIKAGNIKIPPKGRLIAKSIISSGRLQFIYKANKMELGDSYIKIE